MRTRQHRKVSNSVNRGNSPYAECQGRRRVGQRITKMRTPTFLLLILLLPLPITTTITASTTASKNGANERPHESEKHAPTPAAGDALQQHLHDAVVNKSTTISGKSMMTPLGVGVLAMRVSITTKAAGGAVAGIERVSAAAINYRVEQLALNASDASPPQEHKLAEFFNVSPHATAVDEVKELNSAKQQIPNRITVTSGNNKVVAENYVALNRSSDMNVKNNNNYNNNDKSHFDNGVNNKANNMSAKASLIIDALSDDERATVKGKAKMLEPQQTKAKELQQIHNYQGNRQEKIQQNPQKQQMQNPRKTQQKKMQPTLRGESENHQPQQQHQQQAIIAGEKQLNAKEKQKFPVTNGFEYVEEGLTVMKMVASDSESNNKVPFLATETTSKMLPVNWLRARIRTKNTDDVAVATTVGYVDVKDSHQDDGHGNDDGLFLLPTTIGTTKGSVVKTERQRPTTSLKLTTETITANIENLHGTSTKSTRKRYESKADTAEAAQILSTNADYPDENEYVSESEPTHATHAAERSQETQAESLEVEQSADAAHAVHNAKPWHAEDIKNMKSRLKPATELYLEPNFINKDANSSQNGKQIKQHSQDVKLTDLMTTGRESVEGNREQRVKPSVARIVEKIKVAELQIPHEDCKGTPHERQVEQPKSLGEQQEKLHKSDNKGRLSQQKPQQRFLQPIRYLVGREEQQQNQQQQQKKEPHLHTKGMPDQEATNSEPVESGLWPKYRGQEKRTQPAVEEVEEDDERKYFTQVKYLLNANAELELLTGHKLTEVESTKEFSKSLRSPLNDAKAQSKAELVERGAAKEESVEQKLLYLNKQRNSDTTEMPSETKVIGEKILQPFSDVTTSAISGKPAKSTSVNSTEIALQAKAEKARVSRAEYAEKLMTFKESERQRRTENTTATNSLRQTESGRTLVSAEKDACSQRQQAGVATESGRASEGQMPLGREGSAALKYANKIGSIEATALAVNNEGLATSELERMMTTIKPSRYDGRQQEELARKRPLKQKENEKQQQQSGSLQAQEKHQSRQQQQQLQLQKNISKERSQLVSAGLTEQRQVNKPTLMPNIKNINMTNVTVSHTSDMFVGYIQPSDNSNVFKQLKEAASLVDEAQATMSDSHFKAVEDEENEQKISGFQIEFNDGTFKALKMDKTVFFKQHQKRTANPTEIVRNFTALSSTVDDPRSGSTIAMAQSVNPAKMLVAEQKATTDAAAGRTKSDKGKELTINDNKLTFHDNDDALTGTKNRIGSTEIDNNRAFGEQPQQQQQQEQRKSILLLPSIDYRERRDEGETVQDWQHRHHLLTAYIRRPDMRTGEAMKLNDTLLAADGKVIGIAEPREVKEDAKTNEKWVTQAAPLQNPTARSTIGAEMKPNNGGSASISNFEAMERLNEAGEEGKEKIDDRNEQSDERVEQTQSVEREKERVNITVGSGKEKAASEAYDNADGNFTEGFYNFDSLYTPSKTAENVKTSTAPTTNGDAVPIEQTMDLTKTLADARWHVAEQATTTTTLSGNAQHASNIYTATEAAAGNVDTAREDSSSSVTMRVASEESLTALSDTETATKSAKTTTTAPTQATVTTLLLQVMNSTPNPLPSHSSEVETTIAADWALNDTLSTSATVWPVESPYILLPNFDALTSTAATTVAVDYAWLSKTTMAPGLVDGMTPTTLLTTATPGGAAAWPVKHASVMEGDVILGGLMMVHSREDSITCGPIMPQGGIQALEAMLYTLDQVNKQQLLPNITLGAHILDDCDKDTYGLEMAVDFIKGKCAIRECGS